MRPSRRAVATPVIAFFVSVLVVVAVFAYASLSQPQSSSSSVTSTSQFTSSTSSTRASSSRSSQSGTYPEGQPYLNLSKIYAGLGLPKLTYSSYSPYLPSKPNYTLEYQTTGANFQVGSVGGGVISLDQAVGIAAVKAGLNPSGYSLAEADFEPGVIVNSTLSLHPEWILFFARAYDGYWLYGDVGNEAVSVEANVDALTGTVYPSGISPANGASSTSSLESNPTPANLELNVNSSAALDAVRSSSLPGVPEALSSGGSVTFMEPRIVLFGPSSDNEAFMKPLNVSLSGQYALCWVIGLFSQTPGAGYQGIFAVDAGTGQLVSGWPQALYPNTLFESVAGSLNYSSASNLTISQEVFQIDGGIIGTSGSLPVIVPNVVVVKPGSTASMGLNFSSTMTNGVDGTLSFTNPLPGIESLASNGVPQGVSFQFEPQSLVVPENGSANTKLLLSVSDGAPSGTYLIEVNAKLYGPQGSSQGTSSILFFLSVWNGAGEWPPPPTVN
ncbi:MAG: hypothetical protein ACRD6W_05150 [Nitrososphaerales archaeon]